MRHIKNLFLIIPCFIFVNTAYADALIVLDLKPYPLVAESEHCQELTRNLKIPGAIAQHCIFGVLDKDLVVGVFATYGGYLNVSDAYGILAFPYKHTAPKVNLLITSRLTPIMMSGNTIHHWELVQGAAADMFSIERKQDENTKVYFWDTQRKSLPDNARIPLETVIILAKPHHIYVPVGITPTQISQHLVLPNIFIKKGLNLISHALYALNLKHLFGPIRYEYKKEPQRYTRQLIS